MKTLLVLMTMATLGTSFMFQERINTPTFFREPVHMEQDYLPSIPPDNPHFSRQASLMMAASSPRIGLRSPLIGSSDTCHVDQVMLSIRAPRKFAGLCAPIREISYGCRGGCRSYSRVDSKNATNVHRSCSCCSPTGFGFHPVKMQCAGFALRITVKFALGCHCRPCLATVSSSSIQRLRDLLRKTSIANIG